VGKPVICAVDGESDIARVVRNNGLGYVVRPGSVSGLSEAIKKAMSLSEDERSGMGSRSRQVATSVYSMDSAFMRISSLIEKTVNNSATEDLDWLAGKMREVASTADKELSSLGEKGEAFGRSHYSKSQRVKHLAGVVTSSAAHYGNK